jgi:hypothetical protein
MTKDINKTRADLLKLKTSPIRIVFSIILGCAGLLSMLLGAHGISVYRNWASKWYYLGEGKMLFLEFSVPSVMRPMIQWASDRGIHGWHIPVLLVIVGVGLFYFSNIWKLIVIGVRKIRP